MAPAGKIRVTIIQRTEMIKNQVIPVLIPTLPKIRPPVDMAQTGEGACFRIYMRDAPRLQAPLLPDHL